MGVRLLGFVVVVVVVVAVVVFVVSLFLCWYGLCDELMASSEYTYRVCVCVCMHACLIVCDLET